MINPSLLTPTDGKERVPYVLLGKPLPEYRQLVERGKARAAKSSIVFCCIVRDGEKYIPRFCEKLSITIKMFQECRVLFYENDSVDRTLAFLRRFEKICPEATVYSEVLGTRAFIDGRQVERTTNLAAARNYLLDKVRGYYSCYDYYGAIDIDVDWDCEGLMTCFAYNDWDMLGAQGLYVRGRHQHYFDTWAFRRIGEPAANDVKTVVNIKYPLGSPLVKVLSVFGGIGIYKMSSILPYRYEGYDCEHVCLHLNMIKGGHDKIFLNPSMLLVHRR